MPKELIPAGWAQKPCLFLQKSGAGGVCGECEGEFSVWNSRSYCMFCGHLFHRKRCTRKISVEGGLFKQRICSKCYYYRNIAASILKTGEEFECIGSKGAGSKVNISLCEETAELVLHWTSKALKETADFGLVEVRKGFSHVSQHVNTAADNYEPLRCFSLFLKDGVGEQYPCHLRASSALTCQLWVEGLKSASHVYQKMMEQDQALQLYQDGGKKLRSRPWYRRYYLPIPHQTLTSSLDTCAHPNEEWENIPFPTVSTTAQEFVSSTVFSLPTDSSPFTKTSNHHSDLSKSTCLSTVLPRHFITVHSLHFPSSHPKPTISTAGLLSSSAMCHCHTIPPPNVDDKDNLSHFHTPVDSCSENSCRLALKFKNYY